MIDRWIEGGESIRPKVYSFITLRPERFGAILFNPFLGVEEELDPIDAFAAALCNGHNSCRQVEGEVRRRFGLSPAETCRRMKEVTGRLRKVCALSFRQESEASRPRVPDTAVFPEDVPYHSAPKNVVWDVTYACNLSCAHCLTSSGKARPSELDTAQALILIDNFAAAKVLSLSLSGGEPFLRPDILALVRAATEKNMRVDLATNGVKIPEDVLVGLRDLPIFQIQVSIDGIGEQHDRFRGRQGAFMASCRTIRRLREENLAVSISTTVTSENVHELDHIIELAMVLGCSGFKAIPFMPAGRGHRFADRYQLDPHGHYALCETLERRRRELEGQMNISTETTFAFLLDPAPERDVVNGPMGCSAGYDTLNVGSDGTAYPCPFLRDFPLGSLMEQSLKDLWKDAAGLQTLRGLQKQDFGEPCRSCEFAPSKCRGGCRAAAYLAGGDLLAADPTCFRPLVSRPVITRAERDTRRDGQLAIPSA